MTWKNLRTRYTAIGAVIVIVVSLFVLVNADKKPDENRRKPLRQGDITHDGKLVITVLGNPAGNWFPIVLETEYGIMMINDGDDEYPKPRFLLAVQTEKRVYEYLQLEAFQKALQQLPKHAILHLYDQCTVSAAYGLGSVRTDIEQFCHEIGLQMSDERHITCTCY